jgi:hypothetical protein
MSNIFLIKLMQSINQTVQRKNKQTLLGDPPNRNYPLFTQTKKVVKYP